MAEPDARFAAALDGVLDEAGWSALAEDLRSDRDLRARWWAASLERAALAQALGEDRGQRQHQRPRIIRLRLAAAAGLLLAAGAIAWLAWPAALAAPAVVVAGQDELRPDALARFAAVDDALTRRWRLETGRLEVSVAADPGGRGFAIETPCLLVEVTGTRFSVAADAVRTRLEVSDGAVLARAGDEEVMVPAGAWAERGVDGWRLPPGLSPLSALWDAAAHLAGQAPIRRGLRTTVGGVPACTGAPAEETPDLRTIAIDLPAGTAMSGLGEAILEVRYSLAAAGDPRHAPRAMLQGFGDGKAGSLQTALACDRPGQHRQRFAIAGMRRFGDAEAAGRVQSLIVQARPADGLVLLQARILRP